MCRVFLTVLRSNVVALDFYTRLKYRSVRGAAGLLPRARSHACSLAGLSFSHPRAPYSLDERTPSKHGMEASHEILSKCVDPAAR
jgi:hypothetical protein